MSVLFQGGGAFWTNTIFPLQTTPTTAQRPAPEFGNCRGRRWPTRTTNIVQLPIPGCGWRSPEFSKCTSATMRAGWLRNDCSSRLQTGDWRPPLRFSPIGGETSNRAWINFRLQRPETARAARGPSFTRKIFFRNHPCSQPQHATGNTIYMVLSRMDFLLPSPLKKHIRAKLHLSA